MSMLARRCFFAPTSRSINTHAHTQHRKYVCVCYIYIYIYTDVDMGMYINVVLTQSAFINRLALAHETYSLRPPAAGATALIERQELQAP